MSNHIPRMRLRNDVLSVTSKGDVRELVRAYNVLAEHVEEIYKRINELELRLSKLETTTKLVGE